VLDAVWSGEPRTAEPQNRRTTEPLPIDEQSLSNGVSYGLSSIVHHPSSIAQTLISLLAHPNIASKEPIVRTYDHEVQGRTIVKPLVGEASDGPGDAAVLQPLRTTRRGIAIGCGINPRYGQVDPYWMALACVDEALRNVVAVGADPAQAAILDNFCWGDPRQPDRMAGLVRAAAGCYDAALAYGAPFISGKDSLNNEYRTAEGTRIPIPPTLLISALAIVPDVVRAVTMDLKATGNLVYLVGVTRDELLGSHVYDHRPPATNHRPSSLPRVDLALAPRLMAAVHATIAGGLVRSCHDLSEGGLAVAAAEVAIAGGLGLELDLRQAPRDGADSDEVLLFAESPTRFLIEVRPGDAAAFERALAGLPAAQIGTVLAKQELRIAGLGGEPIVQAHIAELKAAWQGTAVV
jgi:phosphoribosylformylglycinamidine (FGAM) synthase-like enzyme